MDENKLITLPAAERQAEAIQTPEFLPALPEAPQAETQLANLIDASKAHQEPPHATLERIAAFHSTAVDNPQVSQEAVATQPPHSASEDAPSSNELEPNTDDRVFPQTAPNISDNPDLIRLQKHVEVRHKETTFGDNDPAAMPLSEFMERINTDESLSFNSMRAAEAEFRIAYPEKAKEYDAMEKARVYTNEEGVADWRKDPAFAQILKPTDPDYDRLNPSGRMQRLARSNPDKVALYAEQYPELKAVVGEAREWRSQPMGNYNAEYETHFLPPQDAREAVIPATDSRAAETSANSIQPQEALNLRDLYDAQTEHRFLPPLNEVAKQRLAALQGMFLGYQADRPEVAGLTLFGSMTKGYATEKSDIDGYLFINADRVPVRSGEAPAVSVSRDDDEGSGVIENQYKFDPAIQEAYVNEFRAKVKAATGLSDEKLRNLAVEPVSRPIIQAELNDLLPWAVANLSYKEQTSAIEHDPQGWAKPQPKRPENRMPSALLSSLFHLQVGKGLTEYQQLLIDELSKQGAAGDFVWEEIVKGTEMMEQKLKVGTGKPYPRTLSDARKLYALL